MYLLAFAVMGAAIAPGIMVFRFWVGLWSVEPSGWASAFVVGSGLTMGFFSYGLTAVLILPLVNLVLVQRLRPWRGPYYSLEAIRWYIHNGITYMLRYTFLELVTPSPISLAFYKMMGMKIGKGAVINSTHISDPSLIELGEKATIGGSAVLIGHYGQGGFLVLAKTRIGPRATIGLRATIMGGVTVGADATVLANSVVLPKTVIPDKEVWGGVPARKIETSSPTAVTPPSGGSAVTPTASSGASGS